MVYAEREDDAANQGDIFTDVQFNGFVADGMITSHDCVCDKFLRPRTPLPEVEAARFTISIAPVHSIDLLTGNRPRNVRRDGMPRYFYLPAEDEQIELVAALYLEQPIARNAVEAMDLSAFFASYRADGHGRAALDPSMMLALLLYAYSTGQRSSRVIERRCSDDVAFRVIAANQTPDHATIACFRVRPDRRRRPA